MADLGASPDLFLYLLAIVAVMLLVAFAFVRWHSSTHEAAAIFQAVLTGAAILVAGYWYVVERRGSPHADLAQQITVVPAGDGNAVVEVEVRIKNLGNLLLQVQDVDIRLQRVNPSPMDLGAVKALGYDQWPEKFGTGGKMFFGPELQWPAERYYSGAIDNAIEPGETDTVTADFVLPCTIKEFRVATEVGKPAAALRWKIRGFASTRKACAPGKEEIDAPRSD